MKSLFGFCVFFSALPAFASGFDVKIGQRVYRLSEIAPHTKGYLHVRFENGARAKVPNAVVVGLADPSFSLKTLGKVENLSLLSEIHVARVLVATPADALELSQKLQSDPRVRFAHPDFIYEFDSREAEVVGESPADEPFFLQQWNLENRNQTSEGLNADIGVRSAWKHTLGSDSTVIALLDLGFEQSHEDLKEAWFINSGEIPNNKKDDDGNGLKDDVSGWNFSINGPNLIYGQNSKHGTATAGIVGARKNGKGVIGICPECKVLPVVMSGRASEDAQAIMYAYKMGASVMSNSWGYYLNPPTTDVVSEALHEAALNGRNGLGTPIIFAMHNANVDDCKASSPDISAHPDVIAVSSVDDQDVKVNDSGYGKCLAFVAPSSGSPRNGITTTDRAGAQGYNTNGTGNLADLNYHNGFWGTSAAAPQVSGLFSLLLSAEPGLTRLEALERMKASAVKVRPNDANYNSQTGHSLKYGFGRAHPGRLFP